LLKQGKEDALLNADENIQQEYIGYRKNACINFLTIASFWRSGFRANEK